MKPEEVAAENLKQDQAKRFSPVARGNFAIVLNAAANKQLGMLDCILKDTGERVAVICAFTPKTMIPLAIIPDNIMDRLVPPEGVKELTPEDIEALKKENAEKEAPTKETV